MPVFTLEEIEETKGIITFFKLLKDGVWQLDTYEQTLESRYISQFITLQAYMSLFANQERLPKSKLNNITPPNERIKEFEFKTKYLRIYCFKVSRGFAIVCGGYKNTQSEDIRHFRSLKKRFYQEQQELMKGK